MLLQPRPFQPRLTAEQLDQLKRDLAAARVPKATYQSSQTKYGITSEWMAKALPYWRDEFDWWPGSFLEFIDVIKILRSSSNPSFHLICPSQPGYGFSSDPPLDRPYGMNDVARLMNSLMCGLGFESGYAAQGGDIGSVIARILAVKYDSCKVININYMPLSAPINPSPALLDLTEVERINVEKAKTFASTGRGYGVLQGTRPGTIGIAVQSSPVALLAWLGEKFRDWTDKELSIDTVLETVTMWWILESYPKAIYAYAELTSGVGAWHQNPALYVDKPFSYSSFASEIASAPQSWAKETGNLQYYKYHARGGHFAALEVPEIFASDMQDCFRKLWPMRKME